MSTAARRRSSSPAPSATVKRGGASPAQKRPLTARQVATVASPVTSGKKPTEKVANSLLSGGAATPNSTNSKPSSPSEDGPAKPASVTAESKRATTTSSRPSVKTTITVPSKQSPASRLKPSGTATLGSSTNSSSSTKSSTTTKTVKGATGGTKETSVSTSRSSAQRWSLSGAVAAAREGSGLAAAKKASTGGGGTGSSKATGVGLASGNGTGVRGGSTGNGTAVRKLSFISEPRPTGVALSAEAVQGNDSTRLDLRGQSIRSLDSDLVRFTPKLEYVYLRDNKLQSLQGLEGLRRVRILDLSFNNLRSTPLTPLAACKMLQQLFLAGNSIPSLAHLPSMPNLEFLSVARNQLGSLAMAPQPKLEVLAATKNKISTLDGFPDVPRLEHLRLDSNAVMEEPAIERQVMLLAGPQMLKLNDDEVPSEVREAVRAYPPAAATCLRMGWKLAELENAPDSLHKFLMAVWAPVLPEDCYVTVAEITQPMEDEPCSCHFELHFSSRHEPEVFLNFKWFVGSASGGSFRPAMSVDPLDPLGEARVEALGEEYTPMHEEVGSILKVECSPIIDGLTYGPVFAISAPVAVGTCIPRITSIAIEGEPVEGECLKGLVQTRWCGGYSGDSEMSWFRCQRDASEDDEGVPIEDACSMDYTPCLADVGCKLRFKFTPVSVDNVRGDSRVAETDIVLPCTPRVTDLQITGLAMQGRVLTAKGTYAGGHEGGSFLEWLSEDPSSGFLTPLIKDTWEYTCTEDDYNRRIVFRWTPSNTDGMVGAPAVAYTSKPVVLSPPTMTDLKIEGDLREGSTVTVTGNYTGGREGRSLVQWHQSRLPLTALRGNRSGLEPLGNSKLGDREFKVPLEAVGRYLIVEYVPLRTDGETGDAVMACSQGTIKMLPPVVKAISVNGKCLEGETVTGSYTYMGGYEGESELQWWLYDRETDAGEEIKESAGQSSHLLTLRDVGKLIAFRCTPVRNDGVRGNPRRAVAIARVKPGEPCARQVAIRGDPLEGKEMVAESEYWGGPEGESQWSWHRVYEDSAIPIVGADDKTYTPVLDDIGEMLAVRYTPVRNDGARGLPLMSPAVGPVLPGPPECKSLTIEGSAVEGAKLHVNAVYKGGEQGNCLTRWFRVPESGQPTELHQGTSYVVRLVDVGCSIRVEWTPVRSDDVMGEPSVATSEPVAPAAPEGRAMTIPEKCQEDRTLFPTCTYFGGQEGEGLFEWFRSKTPFRVGKSPAESGLHRVSRTRTYTPKEDDVGFHLIVEWTPMRKDGVKGTPITACSSHPVAPAYPVATAVVLREKANGVYEGVARYHGGKEGVSRCAWYRRRVGSSSRGAEQIRGAEGVVYKASEDDYGCEVMFGFTPVRSDGVIGELKLSDPSPAKYPEVLKPGKLSIVGRPIEGEICTAIDYEPEDPDDKQLWSRFKKDIKYQWLRSDVNDTDKFTTITDANACTYRVQPVDVGCCLRCDCTVIDIFGRASSPVSTVSSPVKPGPPRVISLVVTGSGLNTGTYTVSATYQGGRQGRCNIQWYRSSPPNLQALTPILGEVDSTYEASADDVGSCITAMYTPVRDDGTEGEAMTASTVVIQTDPEILSEVRAILKAETARFEVHQVGSENGAGEKRILDFNFKRVKLSKPGNSSFSGYLTASEIRGGYKPPFRVTVSTVDPLRLKVVLDNHSDVEFLLSTRKERDIVTLALRSFAQRHNSSY